MPPQSPNPSQKRVPPMRPSACWTMRGPPTPVTSPNRPVRPSWDRTADPWKRLVNRIPLHCRVEPGDDLHVLLAVAMPRATPWLDCGLEVLLCAVPVPGVPQTRDPGFESHLCDASNPGLLVLSARVDHPSAEARWRKAAIWPRVTGSSGQNWVSVHLGTPASASFSISSSKVEPLSSVKRSPGGL